MKYGYEFVVSGCFPLPYDMLRYDRCWPAGAYDVQVMQAMEPGDREYVLTLRSDREPTVARWQSFLWRVRSSRRYVV